MDISKKINTTVSGVISKKELQGFERAYLVANATLELKKLLSPDYMRPILSIQGSKLGFKTDKDKNGGYPIDVVRDCLIEAVLTGVQPHGNQFNIIAGNMYVTKEGFGHLLSKVKGLKYDIIPKLPRVNQDKTSAAIEMIITWSISGSEENDKIIEIPIKMNSFMGMDAVIGKATRKARAWLYGTITGTEIGEGDAESTQDLKSGDYTVVSSTIEEDEETKRIRIFIDSAESTEQLEEIKASIDDDQLLNFSVLLENKENEIIIAQKS